MEYHGLCSITFRNTPYAPNNVPLFPSQIIESVCNLLIFVLIIFTYKKFIGTYKTVGLYCILYSIVRFTLEFFRGDAIRGFILNISTSQWFSIFLFIVGIFTYIYNTKEKKGEK